MEVIKTTIKDIETTFIKTNKFKTIAIDVIFEGKFNKHTATSKNLLQRVMNNSTKNLQSKAEIANRLFDLYDCSISISTAPTYKTTSTVFSLDIIDYKYVNQPNLIYEALKLLKEFIFNPNTLDNKFDEKNFYEEKLLMKMNIEKLYNNKSRYALRKMLEAMCKDEIVSISMNGSIDELDKITPQMLYEEYQNMIKNERVKFMVAGDLSLEEVEEYFSYLGKFNKNTLEEETMESKTFEVEKVKELFEIGKVNQAKLVMGYRTDINYKNELAKAASLFSVMFGGLYTSDLFRVVREENSLCYSISSTMFLVNKLMIIQAGINEENYQLTVDLISKELKRYQDGNIDENLLESAKTFIISDYLQMDDSINDLMGYYYRTNLQGLDQTIDEVIADFKKVSVQDIQRVAKTIQLDTVFMLKSGETNEKN